MKDKVLLIVAILAFLVNLICFVVKPTLLTGTLLAITSLCTGCSVTLNLIARS